MLAGILVVDKYEIIQGELGRNQIYVLLRAEDLGEFIRKSVPGKEW